MVCEKKSWRYDLRGALEKKMKYREEYKIFDFGALILLFLPRAPPMSYCQEILRVHWKLVHLWIHKFQFFLLLFCWILLFTWEWARDQLWVFDIGDAFTIHVVSCLRTNVPPSNPACCGSIGGKFHHWSSLHAFSLLVKISAYFFMKNFGFIHVMAV